MSKPAMYSVMQGRDSEYRDVYLMKEEEGQTYMWLRVSKRWEGVRHSSDDPCLLSTESLADAVVFIIQDIGKDGYAHTDVESWLELI